MVDVKTLGPDIDVSRASIAPPKGSALLNPANDAMLSANILDKDQLRRLASTPPNPIVEDMLMEGTVNLLIGDSGLGKTPLLEQLAICVATGIPFLGLQTTQGKVLFCDAESAGSHFVGYIKSLEQFLGAETARGAIGYYMSNFTVVQEAPVTDFEVRLAEKAELFQPKLIIVDCLRPFWPDAETKSDIAARVIRNLRQMATKLGCAVVIVHHRRKDARPQKGVDAPNLEQNHREWLNEAAGTRSLINQTDCRLGIDIAKGSGADYPEETYCIAGFSKHEGDILPFYFSRVYDENGRPRGYASATPGLNPEQARIFNALGPKYGFSDVFALKGGKSRKTTAQLLKLYVMAGLAHGKGFGNQRHYLKDVDHADPTC